MKPDHNRFNNAAARAIAAGMFVAAFTFGTAQAMAVQAKSVDRVEMRIKDMHAKLRITPEQEDQWQQVAQVMRDNDSTLKPLIEDRKSNARSMSAIDDLHSYEAITEAHAEGVKKFTPAFETLYASMSDDQKKQADTLFRGIEHRKMKGKQ
jgi:Spy/CpxP family protein refolding chaperone